MSDNNNFTKDTFARLLADRYDFSLDEGKRLHDKLGEILESSLLAGGTVKLFGVGALKLISRQDGSPRVRYRNSPSLETELAKLPHAKPHSEDQ